MATMLPESTKSTSSSDSTEPQGLTESTETSKSSNRHRARLAATTLYNRLYRLAGDRFAPHRSQWHHAIRLAQRAYFAKAHARESLNDGVDFEKIMEDVIPAALSTVPENERACLVDMSGIFLNWIIDDKALNARYRRNWVSLADDIFWRSARSVAVDKAARSRKLLTLFRRHVEKALELEEDSLQDCQDLDFSAYSTSLISDSTFARTTARRSVGLRPHSVIVPSALFEVMTTDDLP